jgi:hypothetical protein
MLRICCIAAQLAACRGGLSFMELDSFDNDPHIWHAFNAFEIQVKKTVNQYADIAFQEYLA